MWWSLLSFLCSGMTLAVLSISGKTPFSKQTLTNFESQWEKNSLYVFKRNIGIPYGPVDLWISSPSIILAISGGTVGPR